ncbi:MAG TPA: type III-B CRISPR-associated protein Cas10/Cmr2 [Accumulibacter sp.]|nr:type III-B CRISPR-associated protein Cas10/Cmr2 [Accumulibacter sp.]
MSTWLIEITLGPVQGFIAAARRSRDLWAGSHLLSELVRAAALSLLDSGAKLVYPLRSRVKREKLAEDSIKREDLAEDSNLSNILLASLETAASPDEQVDLRRLRQVVEDARRATRDRLQAFAAQAAADWQQAGVSLRQDFWAAQVADAIEFYAGWVRIPAHDEAQTTAYQLAYRRLKLTLAARKNTRDFAPMFPAERWDIGAGIPKNSFDGLRESVLPPQRRDFPARFGLSAGEQLDALGCIKRVVGRQERFTALSRFAADAWLQRLAAEAPRALQALRTAYEPLCEARLALATRAVGDAFACFPYDGGLLFPERLEVALKASGDDHAIDALQALRRILVPLWREHGRPCPYAVLLVADGDRMGRFIDRAVDPAQHRQISQAVATFADQVPAIAGAQRGQCVFAGGEDLTLFLPLAGVIDGARALQRAFSERMAPLVERLCGVRPEEAGAEVPTLRVGAAICHIQEPLGLIRQRAADAEKFAKGAPELPVSGNALGLRLYLRSGAEIGCRLGFDAAGAADFAALDAWRAAYRDGRAPGRLAYETRALADSGQRLGVSAAVSESEFLRLLQRCRQRGGEMTMPLPLQESLLARRQTLAARADPAGLYTLADELLIARWLSAVSEGDLGRVEGGS